MTWSQAARDAALAARRAHMKAKEPPKGGGAYAIEQRNMRAMGIKYERSFIRATNWPKNYSGGPSKSVRDNYQFKLGRAVASRFGATRIPYSTAGYSKKMLSSLAKVGGKK